MLNQYAKKPVGIFTVSLFLLALVIQFWPESNCNVLKATLKSGFFISWKAPNLFVITSNKDKLSFSSDSQEAACEIATNYFTAKTEQ